MATNLIHKDALTRQGETVFASGARTTTQTSSTFYNYQYRGARFHCNISSVTSTPSTTFTVQFHDPLSDTWTAQLSSVAKSGTGFFTLTVHPTMTASANVAVADYLGQEWRFVATHGNANSMTYSVYVEYLP